MKIFLNRKRKKSELVITHPLKIGEVEAEITTLLCCSQADYDANRCVNIITELGFGEPPLVVHAFQTLAHPFVFPALPGGVASFPVTNTNPSSALTYSWFKHNVICRGQPWICR